MNTSFVNATHLTASVMNRGGRIVSCAVIASVECFVHERAPPQCSATASLSRRRPQSPLSRLCTAVHALASRVGRPRRGSTSEIPDRSLPSSTPGLRALAVSGRSHSVRPNYAFERTVKSPRNHRRLRAAAQRER
jgi:hypothetical protein